MPGRASQTPASGGAQSTRIALARATRSIQRASQKFRLPIMSADTAKIDLTNHRIPSLDGLRAVSIILVLFGHLGGTPNFPKLDVSPWLGDVAHLGVMVFFVISGFLITTLLMNEREKTGSTSLWKFYLRRILRIFPAFYTFILAMVVANYLGWVHLNHADTLHALTYTVNYYPQRSWVIGHLWSLSIEEQFYLLWPLIFLISRKRGALLAALFAFALGPITRASMHLLFPPHSPWRDLEIFPALADTLAIGCIFALLRPWLLSQTWYLRVSASRWLLLTIPLVFAINRLDGYTAIDLFGSPIMLVCIATLIEASTRHATSLIGRFLNWKPIVFVGLLSYSLYLWQQPFLDRHSHAVLTRFPQNILLALLAALLSYYLVERSFLGMRRNLERGIPHSDGQELNVKPAK